jgi:hypothetical protein
MVENVALDVGVIHTHLLLLFGWLGVAVSIVA